jgi:hypothetical protein
MTSLQSRSIDWGRIIDYVKLSLIWFRERQITPTLRTMFYRLVSLELIPNTNQAYKQLSRVTVTARKSGKLRWDSFSDEGRPVLGDFVEEYQTPEEFVQTGLDYLRTASLNYTIPKWHQQPCYVEVWIEKLALADTFCSFLRDRDVKIIVNRGYSGWSFLCKSSMRLQELKNAGKELHVLYFGDCDPSGDDMDRHLDSALCYFGLQDIDFERVAVTEEQIQQFNLPPIPKSQETINKIKRDTRTSGFIEKYGRLYAVELDALLAIAPDEFKRIVQQSVDQFFDQGIYERVLSEHQPRIIDRLVHQRVRFLD